MSVAAKIAFSSGAKIFIVAASLIVNLAIFDVVGAILWFSISLFDGRRVSLLACYAIWVVMGIFAGGIHYSGAVATCRPSARDGQPPAASSRWSGIAVIVSSAIFLGLLARLFDSLWWQTPVKFSGYAPDNPGPTIAFFAAILASMLLARHVKLEEIHSSAG